ncbi:MAG: hypothetical protein ABIL39_11720, partial [candidate division WOR-3 bacterium]
ISWIYPNTRGFFVSKSYAQPKIKSEEYSVLFSIDFLIILYIIYIKLFKFEKGELIEGECKKISLSKKKSN